MLIKMHGDGHVVDVALRCQYFVSDTRGLSLDEIAENLKSTPADIQFRQLRAGGEDLGPHRAVVKGGREVASLAVVGPRSPAFKRITEDFAARLAKSDVTDREAAAARVRVATCILTVDYLDGLAEYGGPKDELAPLWRWVLEHREGVLDVGGRGFARGWPRDRDHD